MNDTKFKQGGCNPSSSAAGVYETFREAKQKPTS